MKKVSGLIMRYKFFLIILAANLLLLVFFPSRGVRSFEITGKNIIEMLGIVPPVFVLLGLLDVWVKRETMIKFMGVGSSLLGIVIAFFLGSAAAGPLFAAFPVAGMLIRKGSKLSNVFIFIGAWSTTKIPLLLFEASALGPKFTIIRLVLDLAGIVVIAYITEKMLSKEEQQRIYDLAEQEI